MKLGRLATTVALTLVLGAATTAIALAAFPASPATGVWAGKTHQELPPLGEGADWVDWSQTIVVRTYGGRLTYLGASLRYVCPDPTNPMAGDVRIGKSWHIGRGPLLGKTGGFVYRERGVNISGSLARAGASGRFDVFRPGCEGEGTWKARRNF